MAQTAPFSVGRAPVRKDALEKASGAARFTGDLDAPGLLHAAVVRANVPRGRLVALDLAPARAAAGVAAVLAAADVPGVNRVPLVRHDYPFLAEDEVRFHGQPLALVAAETRQAARDAAALVGATIEPLEPLLDPEEALRKSAPRIHGRDNVFARTRIRLGDADRALKSCWRRAKGTFETGPQIHATLETQGVLAIPEPGGGMTVTGSLQCPFYVRDAVAAVLALPSARVRVVQAVTGGAFGGKEDVPSIVAGHAALLARATGRPVRLLHDREEDMIAMSRRHPSRVTVELGCNRRGRLVACRARVLLDGGAYATLSPIVLWRAAVHAAGPYAVANVRVDAVAAATNAAPCGAFRGFGQPQVSFAVEAMVDELAALMGLDPLEFRLANALETGARTATGQSLKEPVGLRAALEGVKRERKKLRARKAPRRGILRGVGVAASHYGVGLGAAGKGLDRAGAFVQVLADGSVSVAVGNTEMGQGARTVLAQIAAEGLNAPLEAVDLLPADTSRVPDSGPTVASRTTVMSGNAVLDACRPLRRALDAAAGAILRAPASSVRGEGGFFRAAGGRRRVPFAAAAAEAHARRDPMAAQGFFRIEGTSVDPKTGRGDAYPVYTWSAHLAEVEVDERTGAVSVTRVHSFHDAGTVIHPREARGQCFGGILQGMGLALTEKLPVSDGVLVAPGLASYAVPVAADAPAMEATFVRGRYADGPFGAKGLGEPALIAVPAAILNAVADATGARIRTLPATPERVLEALAARKEAAP